MCTKEYRENYPDGRAVDVLPLAQETGLGTRVGQIITSCHRLATDAAFARCA